jgi:2-amino-4-hydroxy-6-hydroxymethyldihydropteridine diphosphokinase
VAEVSAVIAFGANLGDRQHTIRAAADELAMTPGITELRLSALVESVALTADGPSPHEPGYINAVALVQTTLSPHELLEAGLAIENRHGRTRGVQWAARTLDIDVIAYGDLILVEPDLVIPHPHAHLRTFVLEPWGDLDADAYLPGVGRVADLLAHLYSHLSLGAPS